MAVQCGDAQVLAAWVSGSLDPAEAAEVRAHLETCADCRLLVDAASPQQSRPESMLKPGDVLGPYRIEEWLGGGGMGEVFAAVDERLARRVAVKVLRAKLSTDAMEALRREAQTMAALAHKNVATVFDVGERQGVPYLVMELLPLGSMRRWLASEPALSEVLRAFSECADGLGHAHQAGVVHRDFKPDNVLFAQDGTPRIVDFGLATARGVLPPSVQVSPPSTGSHSMASTLVGTAAFLAPELLEGQRATPASDQYAFGIALRRALHARGGPGRLVKVLERLTATEPRARFPSMAEAARAIRDAIPRPPRWEPKVFIAAGAAAAITIAVLVVLNVAKASACRAAVAEGETLRAEVTSMLAGRPAVAHELGRWLDGWAADRAQQCGRDDALQSARIECLHDQLLVVASVARAAADPTIANDRAYHRVLGAPLVQCQKLDQEDARRYDAADAPRRRALLEAAERALRFEGASREAVLAGFEGQLRETDLAARARLEQLRTSTDPLSPDRVRCSQERIDALQSLSQVARRAHLPGVEVQAFFDAAICFRQRGLTKQARFALSLGGEAAQLLPPTSWARLRFELQRAHRLITMTSGPEAKALLDEARPRVLGLDEGHPLRGQLRSIEGLLGIELGDFAAARAAYEAALPNLEQNFGPESNEVQSATHNLACALTEQFEYEAALARFEKLVAWRRAHGVPLGTPLLSDLVPVYLGLGRFQDALAAGRQGAEEITSRDLKPMTAQGQQLTAWAEVELVAGDPARVEAMLRRLRLLEGVGDSEAFGTMERRVLEARALVRLDRAKEALGLLEEAKHAPGRRHSASPQWLAEATIEAALASGRVELAKAQLPGLPLVIGPGIDPARRALAHLLVARRLPPSERAEVTAAADTFLQGLGPRASWVSARVDDTKWVMGPRR